MPYHPAIGDLRAQMPRLGLSVALLVAAATILTLGPTKPELPSDRWQRLSGENVAGADLTYRLGLTIQEFDTRLPVSVRELGDGIIEDAVAAWERQALSRRPSAAAVYRLGIVYGHRGYHKQAGDYLTMAAGLAEAESDMYFALAQVYAEGDTPVDLPQQLGKLQVQADWLMDIALEDGYRRVGDAEGAAQVSTRAALRSRRFGAGCALIAAAVALLVLTGLAVLVAVVARWGLTLSKPRAPLPFLVPWTLADITEAVAVLVFAMVVGGEVGALLWREALADTSGPLVRAALLTTQYVLVALICLAVIMSRVRGKSRTPLRSLGLRVRGAWRLVGIGVAGYATFLTVVVLAVVALRSLVGETVPLQTGDQLIGLVESPAEALVYFLLACVFAPIFEETIFRGYVYAGLRRFIAPRRAMLVGGLIFAGVHMNGEALVVITMIGVLLCYLYERTRSLLPGMVAHGLHNALVLGAVLLQST